jgi:hypothetical protein
LQETAECTRLQDFLERLERDKSTKLDEKYATDLLHWEITELLQTIENDESGRKHHL